MLPLQFKIQVSEKDALSFTFYHFFRKGSGMATLLIVFFAVAYFLSSQLGDHSSSLLIPIGLTLLYLFIPATLYFRSRKTYYSEKKFQTPMTWTLDESKAVVVGDGFETFFRWDSVQKVVENDGAFIIYQNLNSANLIPKHNLTDGEIAEFRILMINIPGLVTQVYINKANPFDMPVESATKMQRFLNALLDLIIFTLIFSAIVLLFLVIYVKMSDPYSETPPIITLMPYIVAIPVYILYYFLTEYFFQRSPAKWITKTKVVALDYSRPTAMQILGRSLSRCIPFEFVSFLVSSEGVHDLVSKTRVILKK